MTVDVCGVDCPHLAEAAGLAADNMLLSIEIDKLKQQLRVLEAGSSGEPPERIRVLRYRTESFPLAMQSLLILDDDDLRRAMVVVERVGRHQGGVLHHVDTFQKISEPIE